MSGEKEYAETIEVLSSRIALTEKRMAQKLSEFDGLYASQVISAAEAFERVGKGNFKKWCEAQSKLHPTFPSYDTMLERSQIGRAADPVAAKAEKRTKNNVAQKKHADKKKQQADEGNGFANPSNTPDNSTTYEEASWRGRTTERKSDHEEHIVLRSIENRYNLAIQDIPKWTPEQQDHVHAILCDEIAKRKA